MEDAGLVAAWLSLSGGLRRGEQVVDYGRPEWDGCFDGRWRNWRPLLPGPDDAADSDKRWNALSLPFVVGEHGRIGILRGDALIRP